MVKMAIVSRSLLSLQPLLLFAFVLSFGKACSCSDSIDERVLELMQRQANSPDRVIDLDDDEMKRFVASDPPRSYALVVFFDALQLRNSGQLPLEKLRQEFGVVASSYAQNNKGKDSASKVFFCQVELKKAQASFGLFGVTALPHIKFLPPGSSEPRDSEAIDNSEIFGFAMGMAAFVEAKSKQKVGKIIRPPLLSNKQLAMIAGGLIVAVPLAVKLIISQRDAPAALKNSIAHSMSLKLSSLWCIGALFVYFFSVSGGMHNIIRRMPLFLLDRSSQHGMVFFYRGSGIQLGAEGFAIGLLYTIVGLVIAFQTHVVVRIESKSTQRVLLLLGMAISYVAVKQVIFLDNWKTGYVVHSYFPKSWAWIKI